jgi:hypothetical protein
MKHLLPRFTRRRLSAVEALNMGLTLHYVWDSFAFEWFGIRITYRAHGVARQPDAY